MMYSGSESTSSATNIVSRSAAEEKTIMPPAANMASGKTSVVSRPARSAAASSAEPGPVAGCAANASSRRSVPFSPSTSSDSAVRTTSEPCRNRAIRSSTIAEACWSVADSRTWCVTSSRQSTTSSDIDTSRPRPATSIWVTRRARRGTNASTRTPTTAAARTATTGPAASQSTSGAVKVLDPPPSGTSWAGRAADSAAGSAAIDVSCSALTGRLRPGWGW